MNDGLDDSGLPNPDPMEEMRPVPAPVKGRLKLRVVFVVFSLMLCALVYRLFDLQILSADEHRAAGRRQYEQKVRLAPDRGRMLDRNGNSIALTISRMSIAVDPNMVEYPDSIARQLSAITGKPDSVYTQKIQRSTGSFVWLERALDEVHLSPLADMKDEGLIRTWEKRRTYAHQHRAAQVVGFTDIDNRGVSGLELEADTLLKGAPGYTILQRDGRGKLRPTSDAPLIQPRNGRDIQLTLDMSMQGIVESELLAGIGASGALSGTVVALQPNTGEILAIASYPGFDPNNFTEATNEQMRNRAINDMYEPGSTFKTIMAAMLLEEGLLTPSDTVETYGGKYEYGDVTIEDDHPIDSATFRDALVQSSNVVFATQSQQFSDMKFYKYVRDFGFGIYSGVDLPGEVRGIVKKPRQYDKTTKMYMAHGYQLAVTALQLTSAYAAIANGGLVMKPYIIKAVSDDGDMREVSPQQIRRVVSKSTCDSVTSMLVQVVKDGTGTMAAVQGMHIAGKTGTAQQLVDGKYARGYYTSSFAGFFPAENPQIAMVVMLDRPKRGFYGGAVSAPIFGKIARRLAASGSVTIDRKTQREESQNSNGDSATMPLIIGMTVAEARENLGPIGLRLPLGLPEGYIVSQKIAPGTRLAKGTHVTSSVVSLSQEQRDSVLISDGHTTSFDRHPDVRGMSSRYAMRIVHELGYASRVVGSGFVRRAEWPRGTTGTVTLYLR